MKKMIILAVVALFSTGVTAQTKWTVDSDQVTISWNNTEKGHTGTFGDLTADIVFDVGDLENSSMSATVQVASLVADNDGLTSHLLSADFFDADTYPEMTFVSSSFEITDTGFLVMGTLTIKDTQTEVSIPFSFGEHEDGGVFSGEMEVNSNAVGVGGSKIEEPNVVITIEVVVSE